MPGFSRAYSDSVGSKHRRRHPQGDANPERGLCVRSLRSLRGAGGGVPMVASVGVLDAVVVMCLVCQGRLG